MPQKVKHSKGKMHAVDEYMYIGNTGNDTYINICMNELMNE